MRWNRSHQTNQRHLVHLELGDEIATSQIQNLTQTVPIAGEACSSSVGTFLGISQLSIRCAPYFTNDAFKFSHTLSQLRAVIWSSTPGSKTLKVWEIFEERVENTFELGHQFRTRIIQSKEGR